MKKEINWQQRYVELEKALLFYLNEHHDKPSAEFLQRYILGFWEKEK